VQKAAVLTALTYLASQGTDVVSKFLLSECQRKECIDEWISWLIQQIFTRVYYIQQIVVH
jgi:hypothetical protein